MKNRLIETFAAVAALGFVAWLIGEAQSNGAQQTARAWAYYVTPWMQAAWWSAVITLALVLMGLVGWAVYRFRRHLKEQYLADARAAVETVKVISDSYQTWLVNPLGLQVQNLSYDWRLTIEPGNPEPSPVDIYRAIAFLSSKHPTKQIKAADLPELPAPALTWPRRVNLFDLLPDKRGDLSKVVLGVTLDEQGRQLPVSVALEDMVHGAMGGETGAGKSSLAYSLAYQFVTSPQDCRLILADPAGTTWKTFAGHDRLMYPLIADEEALLHVLNELLRECERRTEKLFAPYPTVEKLSEYNALVAPEDRLDYIVAMIDEFPEYMENHDIQALFRRLIRKSRKAGIYLFGMGTSWKATDMDTSIRRQFRTKVHFAAGDPESSKTLLGDRAAADLRDPGRAYAKLPFGSAEGLVELQAAYLDKEMVISQLERPSILSLPVAVATTDMAEQAVVDAHRRGESFNECYRIYYQITTGQPWPMGKRLGSQHTELVKDILRRHGVEV